MYWAVVSLIFPLEVYLIRRESSHLRVLISLQSWIFIKFMLVVNVHSVDVFFNGVVVIGIASQSYWQWFESLKSTFNLFVC